MAVLVEEVRIEATDWPLTLAKSPAPLELAVAVAPPLPPFAVAEARAPCMPPLAVAVAVAAPVAIRKPCPAVALAVAETEPLSVKMLEAVALPARLLELPPVPPVALLVSLSVDCPLWVSVKLEIALPPFP